MQDSLLMTGECLGIVECWVVSLNQRLRTLASILLATTLPLKLTSRRHTAAHGYLSMPDGLMGAEI